VGDRNRSGFQQRSIRRTLATMDFDADVRVIDPDAEDLTNEIVKNRVPPRHRANLPRP
jgi:hypothetical protein